MGIKLKNLVVKFGDFTAINNVTLEIPKGKLVSLLGPSGSGKSTTLFTISGINKVHSGKIYFGDRDVTGLEPEKLGIGLVFQNYALYPHMSVYDNMAFALKLRKETKDEIDKKVKNAAKILDIESLLDRKPKALSGGQRQRVALGRAIVRQPKVFLMDEPLSNLDAKLRVQMRTEISKLHKKLQTTFIYVTHDQTEAMTMGTRIVVMNKGIIQQVDTPQNIYKYPNNKFVASFIGSPQMNFFNGIMKKDKEEVYVCLGNDKILLPREKGKSLLEKGYLNKEVILGIRPENIYEKAINESQEKCMIEGIVEAVELMGAESYIYVKKGNDEMVLRVNGTTSVKVGEKMCCYLNIDETHVFDKDTEERI